MIAMIFAAGLGTRLAPLTNDRPKALVDFLGKTMLENVAEKLVKAGCDKLVINVHHHPAMMKDFIRNHDWGAEVIISDESDMLLDTGGGILKAREWLSTEEHFILYNVDIACDLDIRQIYNYHIDHGNLATLAVKDRKSTRNLIFDADMNLCAWRNLTSGETKISRPFVESESEALAFSGISVLSRNIFPLITESGKFSITNLFLRLAQENSVGGFKHQGKWADLGTIDKLRDGERLFA